MFTLFLVVTTAGPSAAPPVLPGPEERALAYLTREVPRWSKRNRCFSCHNNGDAARALYVAVRLGRPVPPRALADTTAWLEWPFGWDQNGGEGSFSDKKLARLQFAASLAEAYETGLTKDRLALDRAARLVLALQDKDGSWRFPNDALGSPATHGTALATSLARRTLQRADARRHRYAIAKADAWLRKAPVDTVPGAAAVLLGLGKARDAAAVAQRRRCLDFLRKSEARRGGWGPYPRSPVEVFDTALVLIALAEQEQTIEVKAWTKRGRAYLLAEQETDGSWPETTRPSGAESYAQRVSTAGWATLALLVTGGKPN
jgi:hypothetical protein